MVLEVLKNAISFVAEHIKSEYVALFSVLVTIIIYIFNRKSELKYKKYESRRLEYAKLVSLLSGAFTDSEKFQPNSNGKVSKDLQIQFYDVGSSLMLYASKKLYKEYIFFREFTNNDYIKSSKYYDSQMIIYIVANILRQIRKEVGLSAFNQISVDESLGFWVNDIAMNPEKKKIAHQMNYKINMLKVDLFFMNCSHGVFIDWCFYKGIKPVWGIICCSFRYIAIVLKKLLNKPAMKRIFIFILISILCIGGYKNIRKWINTDYGCVSSITYSAGSSNEWIYSNQCKEFDAGSACYARVGEEIYANPKYNIGNQIKITYRFTITGDCSIDVVDGLVEKVETKEKNVVEYTRNMKVQASESVSEDVIIFRYKSKGEGSVSLEIKYDRHIKKEFDMQSTIYFVK